MSFSARVRGRVVPLLILAAVAMSVCSAQTYLPQILDGGGWYTAVQLTNSTVKSATVSLTFNQDTINAATAPWNPPFLEVASTQNLTISAGGTVYLHTSGAATATTQGWGVLTGSQGVVANVIYTLQGGGARPNQDGTSPGVAGATRILLPFDATPGYATGVAIANPTTAAEDISVNIQLDTGEISHAAFSPMPSAGQLAFSIATFLPTTAGHRGVAEFTVASGQMAIAAFRINPTVAITSMPVTLASGPPVIGPPPKGSLEPESLIPFYIDSFRTSTSSNGGGDLGVVRIFSTDGHLDYAYLDRMLLSTDGTKIFCAFDEISSYSFTVTLSRQTGSPGCYMSTPIGLKTYPITAASMVFVLDPRDTPQGGGFTGTFSFTSALTTISGTMTGGYRKQIEF